VCTTHTYYGSHGVVVVGRRWIVTANSWHNAHAGECDFEGR
jgi:hypothetical protein